LKNLLSNAFKFTHTGSIQLNIAPAPKDTFLINEVLKKSPAIVGFAVKDTGIGIAPDKHKVIFESFQQADGTTSREYGGTGLGLSISREIARLLGGEIRLESTPGEGSTFTLYIPANYIPTTIGTHEEGEQGELDARSNGIPLQFPSRDLRSGTSEVATQVLAEPEEILDDRNDIQPGDRTLLVIEDDANFAKILMDMAHEKEFKVIAANRGETGLAYARRYKPDAISLDILLPGIHGLAVLDRLKHDPVTRHIPVQIVSMLEKLPRQKRMGAINQIQKPVSPEEMTNALGELRRVSSQDKKKLLVIEDNEQEQNAIRSVLDGEGDIELVLVKSSEAIERLKAELFDCMVIDIDQPDNSGIELIANIRKEAEAAELPIVVYTSRELSKKESTQLAKHAESVIVKDMNSLDRLLDETSLFLHRNEANLSDEKRGRLENIRTSDATLAGKKVLIVDDDIRNIFAITSFLERHNMRIVYAENGQDALHVLDKTTDVDIILMDIMMPGMDGYETMRNIRKNRRYKNAPMIAVTAKAMRGDREKCIEAGASDYITKPVDVDQLLSLLRVWLFK
ncbi:MAG TPA: response regulator, partial [Candidatus Kapabacteria bacterium]